MLRSVMLGYVFQRCQHQYSQTKQCQELQKFLYLFLTVKSNKSVSYCVQNSMVISALCIEGIIISQIH